MHLAVLLADLPMILPTTIARLAGIWGAFAQTAAATLVSLIWQGTLVACGLAISLRIAPRITAAHRFAVWAAGFVVIAGLPFLPLLLNPADGAGSIAALDGPISASVKPWVQVDIRWGLAIAALWIAASILQAAWLVIHSLRLRRVWKSAVPVAIDDRVADLLAQRQAWGRKPVEICSTTMLQRPSVIGFFAPRILIPDWLLKKLTPAELEQIVLHETEHLRRCDDWTNLLQKLCMVVFPLNPALWWVESRLCREREMACDEGVVKVTRAPRAYAACLASLAERGLERRAEALSLGAWQKRAELVHRVQGILTRKRALSVSATWALLGTMGCGLVFGSVKLAQCPELVAFVPKHESEMAQAISQTSTREPAVELVPATYRYAPGKQAKDAHSFYAMNAMAMFPEPRHQKAHSNGQPLRKAIASGEVKASGSQAAPGSARRELAKASLNTPYQVIGSEQVLIVVASWEEVQTSSHEGDSVSDYATDETGDLVANRADDPTSTSSTKTGPAAGHPANERTITRLIFRIIPASSLSTQPATGNVPGGWFTLQL